MPKARKEAKTATFYLSLEIIEMLNKYCEETGLSKTVAIERFIKKGCESLERGKKSTKRTK